MKASMRILVQRYLDGELNDHERAAFLEDVARDPHVAEVLENETRLDMAIVEDTFSIEPPASLRNAVLEAVSANAPTPSGSGMRSTARMVAVGVLLLTVAVNRFESVKERHFAAAPVAASDARDSAGATDVVMNNVVSNTVVTAPTPEKATRMVVSSPLRVVSVDAPHETTVFASTSFSGTHKTVPEELDVSVAPFASRTWGWNPAPLSTMDAVRSGTFMPHDVGMNGVLSAILSSSGAGVRYRVAGKDEPFFIESGLMIARMTASVYTNGVERQDERQRQMPFALVGLEGPLGVLLLDRDVHASVAIGMASVGPLLVADASVPMVYLGHTSLDAGVRMVGAADLRRSTLLILPQPFLRLSMGL